MSPSCPYPLPPISLVRSAGIALGNGWYATDGGSEPTATNRTFLGKLVVNGETVLTTSAEGGGWTCAKGPITYDSIYNGEIYDARLEAAVKGWDTAGYDASEWSAAVATDGPQGTLVSPKIPPVRKIKVCRTGSRTAGLLWSEGVG